MRTFGPIVLLLAGCGPAAVDAVAVSPVIDADREARIVALEARVAELHAEIQQLREPAAESDVPKGDFLVRDVASVPYDRSYQGSLPIVGEREVIHDGTRYVNHGRATSYSTSGKVLQKGFYRHGKKDGDWMLVSSSGEARTVRYEAGRQLKDGE